MTNLQQMIINYRAKERITQEELADRCGISRVYLNAIETGSVIPAPVTEAKIRLVVEGKETVTDEK